MFRRLTRPYAGAEILIVIGGMCEVRMKTQGEIEAAVSEVIARFEQEYMGRGPKDIHRPTQRRLDRGRAAARRHATGGKGQRPAQTGPNSPRRNGTAGYGIYDPGSGGRPSRESSSRH